MSSIFFWNEWTKPYSRIWFVLFGTLIFSLLFMWFSYFQGANGVIHWERIQEQKIIETTIHNFRVGPFELTIPAESYAIFEYLQGSELHHNTIASYIFLAVLISSSLVLLSIFTTLERFWYLAGMNLFIVFVASLRLDVLLVFGLRGFIVPIAVLVLFLSISFYFKSFRPHTTFNARLLTFLLLAAVIFILIISFARLPFPILHLTLTAYIPALILTIVFIIMVAHEILVSFIYISSQGASKSLRHFSIISLIYLVNIMITCLHEMGVIDWNFIYINLYLLISISAILGIWGFRLRESLYENIFSFSPFGAFFFTALAAICFITIAQLLGNANDAALKVVRDIIIFTHTAFGIIFLMYIFSNFMVMMAENIHVTKVLYKPNRMPYFTFRFAGVIITLAFIFASHWDNYINYSAAGFYNYAADLHQMQGNETFAQAFYDRSVRKAFENHRANYALGMLKASHLNLNGAYVNLEAANRNHPTDFSLVNQGNLFIWQKNYFQAIHGYRAAAETLPSFALSNNLGFTYAKIHKLDSALYYFDVARKDVLTKSSAEANFFGMAAAEYLPLKTDSILNVFGTTSPIVVSNAIALATLFGQKIEIDTPLATKELNLYSATLLNNYIIHHAKSLDTTFTKKAFAIASDSVNVSFSEALKASLSYAFYHQGNVNKAQEILAELAYLTQSYQGKYNYIMGLWAMEQENPVVAQSYFVYAVEGDHKQAKLYNAIALTEAQRIPEALIAWDSLINKEEEEKQIATQIKKILTLNRAAALTLTDQEKYQYMRYMISLKDSVYFSKLVNTFADPNYKAQAILDRAKKAYKADNINTAVRLFNQTIGLSLSDKRLYDELRHFELRIMASRNDIKNLAEQMNKGVIFSGPHALEKILYTALISEAGNDLKTAERNYNILGSWNPYFEDGVLAAAVFYRNQNARSPRSYNILAEAIQINSNSIRLLKAYAAEAARQGMDEYASSAVQRLMELQKSQ